MAADISTPLKNVPENSGERVRRSQRCSGRDGCENTSHAAETSQVDRGEATDQSRRRGRHHRPRLPRNTAGHRRTGLPRDRRKARVVDIRTAHGRLRRPTARLAVLPTEGVVARSDRGGLLTAELRPPCAAVAAGEGCGVGPHWPRGKRRARGRRVGAQRVIESAARHSQSAFNRRRGNTLPEF
ncbi:hypothetical protein EVAR_89651_1 [Eumeta japonica]|uniref:Uncharacterized protein n=1 Tax=Eumeta variegata TaxID=151549 RepID=A0A4C1ZAH8_EUMVA|nr:hypothetical protein EVAR_89651_1 [Eumeta japonica]